MEFSDADIAAIIARRFDNGADFWAGPGGKIYVGNPFSTLSSLGMLHELGVTADHEVVAGGLDMVLDACREDGRVRLGPKTPLYPCYTAEAARVLCRFGHAKSEAVRRTVEYLLGAVHDDGGWRCSFTKFGRGPETECSNPGATLYALDVLRHFDDMRHGSSVADAAVESLLKHWVDRAPMGPCHWGIGTLFMQLEYPFHRYNLFFFVYVLSFYSEARKDDRFLTALSVLSSKLDGNGRIIVARPHRGLKDLQFCAKGLPSSPATSRFMEIQSNLR